MKLMKLKIKYQMVIDFQNIIHNINVNIIEVKEFTPSSTKKNK